MAVAATLVALMAPLAPPVAAQSPPAIAGRVVDASSGAGVAGAHVAALRTGDLTIAGGTVAATDGTYTLAGLDAGTYHLYLIDPAGQHAAAFHGAPATVTVGSTGTVAVNPTMTATRGSLAGHITESGTGTPVAGAWVAVLSGTNTRIEAGAVAGPDGGFTVDDLLPGPHFVVYVDPTGSHRPEFHPDSPGPSGATTISVTAGATTVVDAALDPAPGATPTTTIEGTVTETGSTAPIAGAWVAALDAGSARLVAGTQTGTDGHYSLPVEPGRYLLEFIDPSGAHAMEWYDEQDMTGLGAATPVDVTGPTRVDERLDATTGTLAGSVREDESNDPVAGAWALAIGVTGVRAATAGADGAFRVTGLAPGTYRAVVVDPSGGRGVEYWDGGADYAAATPISVAAGSEVRADTSLPPPRCGHPDAPPVCLPPFPTPAPGAGWSRYDIATGAHSATVTRGAQATAPRAGFSTAAGRRYHFLFDATARYVLTNPTQPEDQFDWNKLPGLSDCGDLDLSQNGWMFGWRWRTDLAPPRLEVTAYANNNGTHLTPADPLVTLTAAQLDARVPLWFDLAISADRQRYEFEVAGPGSRQATATLPRQCPSGSTSTLKWASGFYFGGTSTAPTPITGWINEP